MTEPLFPSLADPDGREAIRIGDDALSYRELAGAAAAMAHELEDAGRVAVWAQPTLELVVAVVGALAAGVAVVPINPGLGPRELGHIVRGQRPRAPAGVAGRGSAGRAAAPPPHRRRHRSNRGQARSRSSAATTTTSRS